jgi:LPXTG-motif cell wall-anchored protein
MTTRRRVGGRIGRVVLALTMVIGVVGSIVGVAVSTSSTAEARPSADGYYYFETPWTRGPFASSDPSHIAYTGSNEPLRWFSGGRRIPLTAQEDQSLGTLDQLARTYIVEETASVSGITGGTASVSTFGNDIHVRCVTPDTPFGYCTVPSGSYTVTLNWTWAGYDARCYYAWLASGEYSNPCSTRVVSDTVTRTMVAGRPADNTTTTVQYPPVSAFAYRQRPDDRFTFDFESRSSDVEDPSTNLAHRWSFGDGAVSTVRNASHRYERAGTYTVSLEVTDSSGRSDTSTQEIVIANSLVVNSTGDDPAIDPVRRGCDTGAKVGEDPECTLRAALDAVGSGGGDITFAIPGGGTPTISAASALPPITGPVSIDGTTQPGGWVGVAVAAPTGLQADGGSLEMHGLAVRAAENSISLRGGSGHMISGNRLGTTVDGNASAGQSGYAVVTRAAKTEVANNVLAGQAGIGSMAAGTTVRGNSIGVSASGAAFGDLVGGVLVLGAGATVAENVIAADDVAVAVSGAGATGAVVDANRIGVSRSGADIEGVGEGIRIDGSPGAKVTGNQIRADGGAAIAVSGSKQSTTDAATGALDFENVWSTPLAGPVTGGGTTISGNTIDGGEPTYGIAAWAGATGVIVDANTVTADTHEHVAIRSGAGHRVTGNQLGTAVMPASIGIHLDQVGGAAVGGTGAAANRVVTNDVGIDVSGTSTGVSVTGNTVVGAAGVDDSVGVRVGEAATGTKVDTNTVDRAATAIASGADQAELTGNTVSAASATGLASTGDRAVLRSNVVVGSGIGAEVDGSQVVVERNRLGVTTAGAVSGNAATGLAVRGGSVRAERNLVAGSKGDGVTVAAGASADLRANRIWATTGAPLVVADGPPTPSLLGAIRQGTGDDVRTTLVVRDLPDVGGGRVEVFANDDCADPEAQHLLETVRTTRPGQTHRVITIRGSAGRDHYTVTYTSPDGKTSNLSSCASVGSQPDGDGDGSVDMLDGALGFEGDPTRAVVVTDDERLLLVWAAGGGNLERVQLGADPAPGEHPAGWQLAYGALGFRVAGLEPGAATKVALVAVEDGQTAGTSYWKYGPAQPGATPTWFRFDPDEATGTGASLVTMDVLGELRRAWVLDLRDGARGDSDGGANGSITDPGGPVLAEGEPEPAVPEEPVVITTTSAVTPTTVASPSGSSGSGSTGTATTSGGAARGALARTGADSRSPLVIGAGLLVAGGAFLVVRRRREVGAAS